jgi:hypothetical protein
MNLSYADWLSSEVDPTQDEMYTLSERTYFEQARVSVPRINLIIEGEDEELTWFRPTVQALAELLSLSENWDSYGARPIDLEMVRSALQLLAETMRANTPPPIVVPTHRGGIQLEWHTRGVDLEVDILSPGRICLSYEDHQTGDEWEGELTSDLTRLSNALLKLARRG